MQCFFVQTRQAAQHPKTMGEFSPSVPCQMR